MSFLYKSASGREVSHISYSALSDYTYCRQLFYLSRIAGYKDKDKRAAFEFGKCVEDAIQFFHANGCKPGDTTDEFKRLWLKWEAIPLVFTAQEGSWKDLYKIGSELARLYEALLPTLPIRNPKFQLNYEKELWPGSNLSDLKFTSFVDMLVTAGDGGRILVDIKTAKAPLSLTPNLLAMDPQLKDYAWATGVKEVGFLWLIKARPDSFKKGDAVTLLEDTQDWKAGQTLSVVKFSAPKSAVEAAEGVKAAPEVPWLMYLGTDETVRIMDEELDKISGKGATEKKDQLVAQFLADGRLCSVQRESVTKTQIQFVRATIPEQDLPEVGQDIGDKTLRVKKSYEENYWPKDGGVRFPNQKCSFCRMRGLCLKQPDLVEQLLVKIGPAVKDDDWLTELEAGEEE
jgi:hypothetical protein